LQRKQRFVADQRLDLPHFESMQGYVDAEFNSYNKAFLAPSNYIVKNWQVVGTGGLNIKVDQSVDSTLFSSLRTGKESFIYRKGAEAAITLGLTDNATNYVELKMTTVTCAQDTVAVWDSTANGGLGEEFSQLSDTATEEEPSLVANTTAFTGNTDRIPLAVVVTLGGIIVSITDSRSLLFHKATDWNFGVTRTDKTISNFKESYDALTTAIKEIKGTSNWYDIPYSGNKVLKEYQNMFITGGGAIEWEGSQPASTLGWSSVFQIEIADRVDTYTINAGSVLLADGQAMYVVIPEGTPPGALTPIVASLASVPIDPFSAGYSAGIQVLFFRRGSTVMGWVDIPDLNPGESASIGQDLPSKHRQRLGIIDENNFVAYTSTTNILPVDSHPVSISKLDAALAVVQDLANTSESSIVALFAAVNSILTSDPIEEHFLVTNPVGQTIFNAAVLKWNVDVNSVDIEVFMNGQKVLQDQAGGSTFAFKKNSETQIVFSDTVPENARITIRNTLSYLYKTYFVNYLSNSSGQTQSVGQTFAAGTERLGVYRNGIYLMKTLSLGSPIDRFVEQSSIAVELGVTADALTGFAFVHQAKAPVFKQSQTGVTGAVLTVPSHTVTSDALRIYRNGLMMNKSGFGGISEQYADTSATSITLVDPAIISDYFIFEYMDAAPTWRQDITGVVGVTVTFSSVYVLGNKKLLVWRNGILLFNSATIGLPGDRYQEATTLTITLGVAAASGDTFTAIYQ